MPHREIQKKKAEEMWIVFMTTYPPRECGIATFTSDLIDSFDKIFHPQEETKVIAMEVDGVDSSQKPVADPQNEKVIFRVSENKEEDYVAAAKYVNSLDQVKLISIQHEFGIFGQPDGQNILVFLREVTKPVVVTFHTVLPRPSEHILEIVHGISEKVQKIIVMTQNSRMLLETVYGIDPQRIKVIHHGIHALPYTETDEAKEHLTATGLASKGSLEGKKVISTFGLLNRGKGIEFAIEALPEIVREFPETQYLVLGATHPVVMRREGPVYLNELRQKAQDLGVADHVTFYDTFIKTSELLKYLQATDVYLALSQNPDQAVSGTLTYALGAGRPVISTPFMQAKEVVTEEVGYLSQFNDSKSISHAVMTLFRDKAQLRSKSKAAYFRTRGMVWPNIAISYMHEFVSLSPDLAQKSKALPPLDISHLQKMTDSFGMFQFAVLDEPNPLSGYTLDDNARALINMAWIYGKDVKHLPTNTVTGKHAISDLAKVYITFLERASNEEGGFINYYNAVKEENHLQNSEENLEDSNARALWAISEAFASKLPETIHSRASTLFLKKIAKHKKTSSPRAAAFYIKAFSVWLSTGRAPEALAKTLIEYITYYGDFLMSILKDNETESWIWFEDAMTYSNAILPEALFYAHIHTGYEHYLDAGKRTLDFLLSNSVEGEVCMPIGQAGWFKRGGVKESFDQQPEEVSALVLALRTALQVTKDEVYYRKMECTFSWFLGNNMLGQVIYSHATGGCYDGLGDQYINLNQGAESTVSYLLARLAMEDEV